MKRVPLSANPTQTFDSFVLRLRKATVPQAQALYLQNQDLFVHRPDMLTRLVSQLHWTTGLAVLSKAYFVHKVEKQSYRAVAAQMNNVTSSSGGQQQHRQPHALEASPQCCWRSATRLLGTALEEYGSETPWQMYTSVAKVCARSSARSLPRRWELALHLLRVAEARNATSAPLLVQAARCCATPAHWALAARLLHVASTSDTYALPFLPSPAAPSRSRALVSPARQLEHEQQQRDAAVDDLELAIKRRIEDGAGAGALRSAPLFALEPALSEVLSAAPAAGCAALKRHVSASIGDQRAVRLLELAGVLPSAQDLLLESYAAQLVQQRSEQQVALRLPARHDGGNVVAKPSAPSSWELALRYVSEVCASARAVAVCSGSAASALPPSGEPQQQQQHLSELEQEEVTLAFAHCLTRFDARGVPLTFSGACRVLDAVASQCAGGRAGEGSSSSNSSSSAPVAASATSILHQVGSQQILSRVHVQRLAWYLLRCCVDDSAGKFPAVLWRDALELAAIHGCGIGVGGAATADGDATFSADTARILSKLLRGLYAVSAASSSSAQRAVAINEAAVRNIIGPVVESLHEATATSSGGDPQRKSSIAATAVGRVSEAQARRRHLRSRQHLQHLRAVGRSANSSSSTAVGSLGLGASAFTAMRSKTEISSGVFALSPEAVHAAAVLTTTLPQRTTSRSGDHGSAPLQWQTALAYVQSLALGMDKEGARLPLHHRTLYVLLQHCVAAAAPEKAMQLLNMLSNSQHDEHCDKSKKERKSKHHTAPDSTSISSLEALLFCRLYNRPREAQALFDGLASRCIDSNNKKNSRKTESEERVVVALSGVYWDMMTQMGHQHTAKHSLARLAPGLPWFGRSDERNATREEK